MLQPLVIVLLDLLCLDIAFGIQYSFTPSPNITILQSAVYQCAVSEVDISDTVTVQWSVNGISSSSPSWQSYISSVGIVADGIGTQDSTLTIPGDPILNETIVTCIALGLVNGELYGNTSSVTLYIQGQLNDVSLQCTRMSNNNIMIYCNWTVPYTISGVDITEYRVNVTNSNGEHTELIQETQYTYSICDYTNISVAAVIGELEGEIDSQTINMSTVTTFTMNIDSSVQSTRQENDVLMTKVFLEDPKLCGNQLPYRMMINSTSANYNTTNITRQSDNITGVFMDIERGISNYSLTIEYQSGVMLESNNNILINSFDAQELTMENNPSTGEVCFIVEKLSSKFDSFLEYNCSESGTYGNLTIQNTKNCTTINISSTHNYTVSVYDIMANSTTYTKPAITTTTALTRTSLKAITSSTQPSPIPTTDIATSTSSIVNITTKSSDSVSSIDVTVILTVFGILIIVILIVVIVTIPLVIYCKKRSHMHKSELPVTQPGVAMNYIQPNFSSNRPIPSVNTSDTTFPYTDVRPGETEKYAKLIHHPVPVTTDTTTAGPDIYNTLHHHHTDGPVLPVQSSVYSTLQQHNGDSGYATLPGHTCTCISQSELNAAADVLTYKYVVDNVVSRIPHKWEEFGRAVAMTPDKIQEIRDNHPNNDRDTFCDIILEWQSSQTIRPFTIETLNLVMNTIGEE